MKRNYQKELETILSEQEGRKNRPSLLIHSCCAPCSSYVLEYLSGHFDIAVFYYNPNIAPKTEYFKRLDEQMRLIGILNADKAEKNNPGVPANGTSPDEILLISGDYDQDEFLKRISGLENEPEGGMRCSECYRMRLERTAQKAAEEGFDFFTTTLTVSPYKNADMLNEIGGKAAEKYNVMFLPSDFKKNDGYKRSIELSRQYGLYRQDYCGCVFSVRK